MNITSENILLVGSILLFVSLLAGKTSYRFGIPVLVFFLVIGMLAGSEGIGRIYFDNPKAAQFIGIIALSVILFSGGLDTSWESVKPVVWQGVALSTLGVMLTAVILGLFVWKFTDFSFYEGLLLGSIVSSTDSAAVFSILRSKKLGLKHNLRPTLELESGSNDPMAYVLTIAFTSLVTVPDANLASVLPMLVRQLILGAALGLLSGKLSKEAINKIKLDFEGLYTVLIIAIMLFTFSFTDFVGGNGFLAVYLCGIYLGNQELIHKKKYLKSFDGFAWLMQIVLFITLGLLVFPSNILPVIGVGMVISLFLIIIARPVSVFITLSMFKIQNRSRWFISWVGLRGAVPIVFATYPLIAGAEKASMIFNIVFFISLTSVLLQGTTLAFVARFLHVTVPEKAKQRTKTDIEITDGIRNLLTEIVLPQGCSATGRPLVELAIPPTSLISLIQRDGKYIVPNGATILQPGDKLHVISENRNDLMKVFDCLSLPYEENQKEKTD
ncbi:MAG TPA: potassium/proton antiporter [Bacteroidales bacterium]|nr:potassium/proton antiporter [Bacteroidales bacterium]